MRISVVTACTHSSWALSGSWPSRSESDVIDSAVNERRSTTVASSPFAAYDESSRSEASVACAVKSSRVSAISAGWSSASRRETSSRRVVALASSVVPLPCSLTRMVASADSMPRLSGYSRSPGSADWATTESVAVAPTRARPATATRARRSRGLRTRPGSGVRSRSRSSSDRPRAGIVAASATRLARSSATNAGRGCGWGTARSAPTSASRSSYRSSDASPPVGLGVVARATTASNSSARRRVAKSGLIPAVLSGHRLRRPRRTPTSTTPGARWLRRTGR